MSSASAARPLPPRLPALPTVCLQRPGEGHRANRLHGTRHLHVYPGQRGGQQLLKILPVGQGGQGVPPSRRGHGYGTHGLSVNFCARLLCKLHLFVLVASVYKLHYCVLLLSMCAVSSRFLALCQQRQKCVFTTSSVRCFHRL